MTLKTVKRPFHLFYNMKLRTKLLLSNILLLVISLGSLYTYSYDRISINTENHILYSAEQGFDQTFAFLSYTLYKIEKIPTVISTDRTISAILSRDMHSYDIHKQLEDMNTLQSYLPSFQDEKDVFRVRLYVRDGLQYSNENKNIFNQLYAEDTAWYKNLIEHDNNIEWIPSYHLSNTEILSVARLIKSTNNYKKNVGIVMVVMLEKNIRNIIEKANTVEDSLTYIQNREGIIITSSDNTLANKFSHNINIDSNNTNEYYDWKETDLQEGKYLVKSRLIENTDWYMTTIVPFGAILSENKRTMNEMLPVVLIIAIMAYLLAFFISNMMIKRILRLIKSMRHLQIGNFRLINNMSEKDEVGVLIENYNFMVKKIEILLEEQYSSGQEVKNAELKALQAQINPHFLYNTLDLIKWMSLKKEGAEVGKIVDALASFYKLGLNKGRDVISIDDELLHVASYIEIQNIRYSNNLILEINVNEDIRKCSILKTMLQPLIENSILHGILRKSVREGLIVITGKMEFNNILISIQDDGVGIETDHLHKIYTGTIRGKNGSGYGIKNINERIKLYYGEKYGLTYSSKIGKGTTVDIRIPATKMDETDK